MAKTSNQESSQEEPKTKNPRNDFIDELSALTYYQTQGTKTKFESLPEAEKETWAKMAASVLVSLDKMNRMVVPKVAVEDAESRRGKNLTILTSIIDGFVRGLKTLRCPKCGSTADSRAALFPSEELAHRILNGRIER